MLHAQWLFALGSFYAAEKPDESVLALSTDNLNNVLVSGDTTGRIVVWDIDDYCLLPRRRVLYR